MSTYTPITGRQIHEAFQSAATKFHNKTIASYEACGANGFKEQYEQLASILNHTDNITGQLLYEQAHPNALLRRWEVYPPHAQGFYEYLAGLLRRARGERVRIVAYKEEVA